jgi:tetratricopeptide (TPR) repeat protein
MPSVRRSSAGSALTRSAARAAWLPLAVATALGAAAMLLRPLAAGAQSASPAPSPAAAAATASAAPVAGPSQAQVGAEVLEFTQFIRSLARNSSGTPPYELAVKPKHLKESKKYTLEDQDIEHLRKHREQVAGSQFFKLVSPAQMDEITNLLDEMATPQDLPAGVGADAGVVEFHANQQIRRWTIQLADALGAIRGALAQRQKQAGNTDPLPELAKPQVPSAPPPPSPSPSPGIGAPAGAPADARRPPPSLLDEQLPRSPTGAPVPAAGSATGPAPAPEPAGPPCDQQTRYSKDLRKETQSKLRPILELVSAGERALRRRYFEDARDALEKAADATDDLERKWHQVVTETVQSVSQEERFKPECVKVISEALSQAIAMKDLLKTVYPKLGKAYFELGSYKQAAEQIARSSVIDPTDPKTWDALGQAEFKRESYDAAITAFTNSTRLDPYQPEVWVRLARAYAKKNEVKKAIEYLRRAVSKGFVRFDDLDEDPDLIGLQGDKDFEELVHMAPGTPY